MAFPWILFFVFLFSAFRFEVGCDWLGYEVHFGLEQDVPFTALGGEPFWWGLIQLLQELGFSYLSLNVLSSAIFFFGLYRLAIRQPDPLTFLTLLFPVLIVNLPMSGIRQATAAGVLCLAFNAFADGRRIRFPLYVAIASLFHTSAAVFLFLWPLVSGRLNVTRVAFTAALALPGVIFLAATEVAQVAASRYFDSGVEAAGAIYRVGLLALTGAVYLLFYRSRWIRSFPSDHNLVSVGACIMIMLPLGLIVSSVVPDRAGYYLTPIQAIILARMSQLTPQNWLKTSIVLPYVVLILTFIGWMAFSSLFDRCYVPYETWLFGVPNTSKY